MVRKGKNSRKGAKGPNRSRRARRSTGPNSVGMYASLLRDPCNGPIGSYYGGETGIVQRFTQDVTLNTTAGHTCGFIAYTPASNTFVNGSAPATTTAITPTASGAPGVNFLATNASKSRALAACVTAMASAVSMTNMTGEIAVAIVASNNIEPSTPVTTDSVFQLCNQRSILAKRSYDVKWYPQLMDSTYNPTVASGAATLSDPADHNTILVAWRGYPAGVGLSFRLTSVAEWTPKPTIGVSVTSAPREAVNHQAINHALYTQNPHWWHNIFGDVAQHVAGEVGKGIKRLQWADLASYGVAQAVRYGVRSMPALLA